MQQKQSITGCILGTAVGDALGLPYEGLGPERGKMLLGEPDRHHLFFNRGMVSDDTDHTLFVVKALMTSGLNPDRFERHLAASFRWWIAGLPAGVGFATLRSILKLWIGFPAAHSGVFSAGNGPAMRSAMLGVCFGDDREGLKDWVFRATRITHTDPKAFWGALSISIAAHMAASSEAISARDYMDRLGRALEGYDAKAFMDLMAQAADSASANENVRAFAAAIGSKKGISGYTYHTVPCVIQTWLRYPDDFAGGIGEIIRAGGDTDTTAAILGAIIGARVGKEGIPGDWRNRIVEWPKTVAWMEEMGRGLAAVLQGAARPGCPGYFVPGVLPRNLFFLSLVLCHGLRRLFPPF